MDYKHCVFCAGIFPCNEESIRIAKKAMDWLDERWSVEADVVLCDYHSKFTYTESGNNVEIYLTNDDLRQLIKDCMEWAVTTYSLKSKTI